MPSIELKDLKMVTARLDAALRALPNAKRELHEELAEIAKRTVDASIDDTMNDSHAKMKNWQHKHLGSGGGYAAIRPASLPNGPNGPGAITGYVESGHRNKKHTAFIAGRHMYRKAKGEIETEASERVSRFINDVVEMAEGRK